MKIQVVLKPYLMDLQALELKKPVELRRPVPTLTDLAKSVGVSRVTISYLANDKGKTINLNLLANVIEELRRRGFDTQFLDLFDIREDIPAKTPQHGLRKKRSSPKNE